MKIYEIKIKPTSFFITPLQGDTLFGNLCWQLHNKGFDLDKLLEDYATNPFMVVSSGFFYEGGKYILPRPLCPDQYLFKDADAKKNKDKKYFALSVEEKIDINNLPLDKEHNNFAINYLQGHNSISRIGGGNFAPYYTQSISYDTAGVVVIFVGIDETRIEPEYIKQTFIDLGKIGYGKKASSGYGQFTLVSCQESLLWNNKDFSDCNALYILAPFIPSAREQEKIKEKDFCYFQPITKYGKHGNIHALGAKPFKKPVIMADTASVVPLGEQYDGNKPYIGTAIKNSYIDKTVMQGYALCLPCKFNKEGYNGK